ncbi:MAG: DUF1109 family protein [Rhodobacteraceae bacterium]|nr:DUF1109 family protein [Paracoccaceae bacterium]
MTTTPELIATLASHPTPIRRYRPPVQRAVVWLSVSALLIGVIAIEHPLRPDLPTLLHQTPYLLTLCSALATGVLAAIAAFLLSVPDRSRLWGFLPLPPMGLWLSSVGYQCLTHWVAIGPKGITLGQTADCFATLTLVGLPLGLAASLMLHHAARLDVAKVSLLASLAVSGMTAVAMSLFHPIDASVLILTFNVGSTAVLLGLGLFLGTRFRRDR